jgi:8-oxo-dGTP pyrophosphatase MutT (NUDIX family)
MQITVGSIRNYFQTFQRSKQEYTGLIPAAVLILLLEQDSELHIVLTKRTESVQRHKGQVSFPGGTKDVLDATITYTALREAREETGLMPKDVEVMGLLNDFCTPSGFCITPVVGFLPFQSAFVLNKTEVAEIFSVPLSFFLNSCNERSEQRELSGKMKIVYFYRYGIYEIWGATAEILRTFLHALTGDPSIKRLCKSGNS